MSEQMRLRRNHVSRGLAVLGIVAALAAAGMTYEHVSASRFRTTLDVVKDLHFLLSKVGVPPPYVLVGHSIAGFNVRVFTAYYPEDVAGVVLVDASHEDVDVVIPRGRALLHLPRAFRQMVVG